MTTIKNYENYTINEDGVVINTKTGREAKPTIANNGYYVIGLRNDNKRKLFLLHRLIALAFIPNPDNKPQIDHINTNRLDNRLENLRWVSIKENRNNQKCRSNTGKQFISKRYAPTTTQGFRYEFYINRPELRHFYSNKDLQPVIEYRNKFCEENNIEFNDSL